MRQHRSWDRTLEGLRTSHLHGSFTQVRRDAFDDGFRLGHLPDNGPAFNGRPGAEPRWDHQDRSARPVRCSAWLAAAVCFAFRFLVVSVTVELVEPSHVTGGESLHVVWLKEDPESATPQE